MLADDDAVRRRLPRAGRPARGRACRRRPRRPEHGHAGHDPLARGRRAGDRRGDPRRAGLGQRHARPVGPADAHGRRHRRGPRAGAAGPRAAREDDRPRRPARVRGGDEARGQHRDLRVERGARGGARPRRGSRRSTERSPTTSSPTSAVGAPYVGYKRAAFLEPDATPVAFALDLAAKDLRPDPRPGRRGRAGPAAVEGQSRRRPDGVGRRSAAGRTSRRSRRTCGTRRPAVSQEAAGGP